MKTHHYKDYLIILESAPHGGIAAAAIPDNGRTIRCTYYGYTFAQARREIVNRVKEGGR